MQTCPNYPTMEISPESVKAANTCFVCDKKFRSARALLTHQQGGHTQVLIFEINREDRKIKGMSTLWRVADFDDLFASQKVRRRRIRKATNYCSSDTESRTEPETSPCTNKLDI